MPLNISNSLPFNDEDPASKFNDDVVFKLFCLTIISNVYTEIYPVLLLCAIVSAFLFIVINFTWSLMFHETNLLLQDIWLLFHDAFRFFVSLVVVVYGCVVRLQCPACVVCYWFDTQPTAGIQKEQVNRIL